MLITIHIRATATFDNQRSRCSTPTTTFISQSSLDYATVLRQVAAFFSAWKKMTSNFYRHGLLQALRASCQKWQLWLTVLRFASGRPVPQSGLKSKKLATSRYWNQDYLWSSSNCSVIFLTNDPSRGRSFNMWDTKFFHWTLRSDHQYSQHLLFE